MNDSTELLTNKNNWKILFSKDVFTDMTGIEILVEVL